MTEPEITIDVDQFVGDPDEKIRAVLGAVGVEIEETGAGTLEAKQRMLQAFNKFFCCSQLEVYRLMADEAAEWCVRGMDALEAETIHTRVSDTLFAAFTKQEMPHLREKRGLPTDQE